MGVFGMTIQPTSGIWKAEDDTVITDDGVWLLPHIHDSWEGNRSFPNYNRQRANARMFAASKDLYNAARALLNHPDDIIPTRLWNDLRKAVKKAENG
jgi:hypothetical protein